MDSMFWLFKQLVGLCLAIGGIALGLWLLYWIVVGLFRAAGALLGEIAVAADKTFRTVMAPVRWIVRKSRKLTPEQAAAEQAEEARIKAAALRIAPFVGDDKVARQEAERRRQLGYDK